MKAGGSKSSKGSKVSSPTPASAEAQGGNKKAKIRRKPVSKSKRGGLEFPVETIHQRLEEHLPAKKRGRVKESAAVYTAAVLEYVCSQILDIAGNACEHVKKKRITPRHLAFAVRADEELDSVLQGTIPEGGVFPSIHESRRKSKKDSPKK